MSLKNEFDRMKTEMKSLDAKLGTSGSEVYDLTRLSASELLQLDAILAKAFGRTVEARS